MDLSFLGYRLCCELINRKNSERVNNFIEEIKKTKEDSDDSKALKICMAVFAKKYQEGLWEKLLFKKIKNKIKTFFCKNQAKDLFDPDRKYKTKVHFFMDTLAKYIFEVNIDLDDYLVDIINEDKKTINFDKLEYTIDVVLGVLSRK